LWRSSVSTVVCPAGDAIYHLHSGAYVAWHHRLIGAGTK